jgi:hypothetical protein
MTIDYSFVSGDTGSELQLTCTNKSGAVINLTGATIALRWFNRATEAVIERAMTIMVAASGTAKYKFLAGELVSPSMSFEVRITDSGGFIVRSLQLVDIPVRQQLP